MKVMSRYKSRRFSYSLALLLLTSVLVSARDIYVNNKTGNDTNSGLLANQAFRTIVKATSQIKPGDVLHIANTGLLYKEYLFFPNTIGTPEAPITVEGNGAVLSGSERLNIDDWEKAGPGLYKNSKLYPGRRFNMDVVNRYFFLFDGKMNRMGRALKGQNIPFKQPAALNNNEWTFVEDEKTFYLKIDPAKNLADLSIEHPVRATGVQISGNTSYVTIRNITSTNYYNDGFGITGTPNHVRFENIQALYCGDDGISAHAASQYDVDGFISIGNGTGLCDTGNSRNTYNRVFIKDCVGVDLYYLNEKPDGPATYTIRNSVVICHAARPVVLLTEKPNAELSVTMDNVLFVGKKEGDISVRVNGNTDWIAKNCTFIGLNLMLKGRTVRLEDSVVRGPKSSTAGKAASATGFNKDKLLKEKGGKNAHFARALALINEW